MTITTAQLELRRKYLGSSDVAAILGCHPYRSAADVQLEKLGRLEDLDLSDEEAVDLGTDSEPYTVEWAARKLGAASPRDAACTETFLAANGVMCSHPDGLLVSDDGAEPIEGKYSGRIGWERGTARLQTPRPVPAPSAKLMARRLSALATGYYMLAQPTNVVILAIGARLLVEPGAWAVSIDGPWLRISRKENTRCKECGEYEAATHVWRGASLCAECQSEAWRRAGLCEKCGGDIWRTSTNRPDGTDDGGSCRQCIDCQWSPDE